MCCVQVGMVRTQLCFATAVQLQVDVLVVEELLCWLLVRTTGSQTLEEAS